MANELLGIDGNSRNVGGGLTNDANLYITNFRMDPSTKALLVSLAGGATGGTSSAFGAAIPATGTAAGFSDGTNMQAARVFDTDTGAGTEYTQGANIRISGNGGSIEAKGQQVMASSLPVTMASDQTAILITPSASTSSVGTTTYFNSALSTTVTAVKASAGRLYGFHIQNPSNASAFVQVFNVATGSVTLGTTVPNLSFFIPMGSASDGYMTIPASFSTAISIAATTTATGLTAPSTALVVNMFYI